MAGKLGLETGQSSHADIQQVPDEHLLLSALHDAARLGQQLTALMPATCLHARI